MAMCYRVVLTYPSVTLSLSVGTISAPRGYNWFWLLPGSSFVLSRTPQSDEANHSDSLHCGIVTKLQTTHGFHSFVQEDIYV